MRCPGTEGTRRFFEVQVGQCQCAEVILHIRRQDLPWWRQQESLQQRNLHQNGPQRQQVCDEASGETKSSTVLVKDGESNSALSSSSSSQGLLLSEVFYLLETSILPRMFLEEIEKTHAKAFGYKYPKSELGPGGRPLTDLALGRPISSTSSTISTKAGGIGVLGTKRKRVNKRQYEAEMKRKQQQQQELEAEAKSKDKDVFYAFGTSLQLMYRLQDIKSVRNQTLVFVSDSHQSSNKGKSKIDDLGSTIEMRHLRKLSKRIVMWCYPLDANNPLAPNPPGGGFPRPELVPITNLFRQPLDGSIAADEYE